MRQPYKADSETLLEEDLPTKDPVELFTNWFQQAKNCKTIYEPNAVCLASADSNGQPSARMVLLKAFGAEGFKIFTNLCSRKGSELLSNPKAALLFYWDPMNRQVRVEGQALPLPDEEARQYFESRPKKSQLGAAISEQSAPIESRQAMIQKYVDLEEQFSDATFVPKPKTWGGFKIVPERFEFWQGQSSRLHDRIIFRKSTESDQIDGKLIKQAANGWVMERLQP
jgi:pyridoxamine 5'-phosphate oxidase